jgi:hypothetical protein
VAVRTEGNRIGHGIRSGFGEGLSVVELQEWIAIRVTERGGLTTKFTGAFGELKNPCFNGRVALKFVPRGIYSLWFRLAQRNLRGAAAAQAPHFSVEIRGRDFWSFQ